MYLVDFIYSKGAVFICNRSLRYRKTSGFHMHLPKQSSVFWLQFGEQSPQALGDTIIEKWCVVASMALYPVACEEIFRIVGACRRRMSQSCG